MRRQLRHTDVAELWSKVFYCNCHLERRERRGERERERERERVQMT